MFLRARRAGPACGRDGGRRSRCSSPDDFESVHEPEALRFWDGHGAVRLIAHDPERKALLLERCVPGHAARNRLRRRSARRRGEADGAAVARAPAARSTGRGWTMSPRAGSRELPQRYPRAARSRRHSTRSHARRRSQERLVLCHQDLHGGNILRAEREPWLAIDPKPIVAERAYDTVGDRPGRRRRRSPSCGGGSTRSPSCSASTASGCACGGSRSTSPGARPSRDEARARVSEVGSSR